MVLIDVLIDVLHQVCIAKNAIGILGCNSTLSLLFGFIYHYTESVGLMSEVNNLDRTHTETNLLKL